MIFESYLPQSPPSVKLRPKRRSAITSTSSPRSETTTSIAMGIVDYEQQSSGIDSAAEPPPGCDRDSLWWALVMVASQRYDEMTQQEAEQEEASKIDEPISTVVQEEDGDDRLVIDEAEPPTTPRDAAKGKTPEEPTSGDYQFHFRSLSGTTPTWLASSRERRTVRRSSKPFASGTPWPRGKAGPRCGSWRRC